MSNTLILEAEPFELPTMEQTEAWETSTFEDEAVLLEVGGAGLSVEKTCWVQNILNHAEGESLAVDGVFGPLTRGAVQRFQSRRGLQVDGVVGPQTETALIQTGLNDIALASVLAVDGVKNARTQEEIRQFQTQSRLVADGIVGPITRGAMITALGGRSCAGGPVPLPPGPKPPPPPPPAPNATSTLRRVWAFTMGVPATTNGQNNFVKRIADLQLTDVAMMVNSNADREFQLSAARVASAQETARRLSAINVATHWVTWIRPTEKYMTEAATRLRDLCASTGARSLMFDVEEPWTLFPGQTEAKARIAVDKFWRFTDWPCLLGASGITFMPASVKPVAERCHYVVPQAYSVQLDGAIYRPGVTQVEAHKRWRGFGKPIVMGLAAYRLNRPEGISQKAAMQKAVATTGALINPAVTEVAYWSLEWLRDPERAAYVKEISLRARTQPTVAGSSTRRP